MTPPSPTPPPPAMDPERWIDDHGDALFHYALARVRRPGVAEDLVQEALLAAWQARDRFAGRSSERSWLMGILKHKVLDHLRRVGRETSFTDLEFYEGEEARSFADEDFPAHWQPEVAPTEWNHAGAALDSEAFWRVFLQCQRTLPERVARVFLLREVDQLSSEEICASLQITPGNLWVMLHRARLALRRCLEERWFLRAPPDDPKSV